MNRQPVDPDTRAIRRASRVVGLQITIASGALVLAVVGAAYFFILDQLRPTEVNEPPRPGENKIYINAIDAMIAFIVIGVCAVVIAGVLALYFTRRAVDPIGRALRMQRTFVQDASHELRTPLTVLDTRLQVLQRQLDPADPVASTVRELRADSRALIEIVGDLLLAANGGGDLGDDQPAPVWSAVNAAASSMNVLAAERGIRIVSEDLDGAAFTMVPSASLQRCVTALLDNALAHSPDRTEIRVVVARHRSHIVITVADHGSGIQGIDTARVFDRFAHTESTTMKGRTSFGLGLALVHDVAMRHGGTVEVRETSPAGTIIALTLPAGQSTKTAVDADPRALPKER